MVIVIGLGFTGTRLARRLLAGGADVFSAVRDVNRFRELAEMGLHLSELTLGDPDAMLLPQNSIMAVLIPPLPEPENGALRKTIQKLAPRRVVYVSSTGVYGGQVDVDQDTPAKPNDERGRRRVEEERWIASGPWTSLILRAAAIYGPGRGVHAALREGKLPRSAGSGIVSRIHVDDLARLVEAGMFSDVQGAWPVADDVPCSSAEITQWCREIMRLEPVGEDATAGVAAMRGRRVDGRAIRDKLGVQLRYPSWQAGIEASLAEENTNEFFRQSETRQKVL